MTALTPPPDREPPRHQRKAMQAMFNEADPSSSQRGFWAPLAAALAVLVVGGGIFFATQLGGESPPGLDPAAGGSSLTLQPSQPSTGSAPAPPRPTSTPATSSSAPHPPSVGSYGGAPGDFDVQKCVQAASTHPGLPPSQQLREPTVAAQLRGTWGITAVLTDGPRWMPCDTSGTTSNQLSLGHPNQGVPPADDPGTYMVDEYWQPIDGTTRATSRYLPYVWAAGVLPDGVRAITYTFPDGGTAEAEIDGDYWLMQYAPNGEGWPNRSDPDNPITVTVAHEAGNATYELTWGEHTCNTINHGC